MKFEWDANKNITNLEKHGISFEDAQEVFLDPLHLSILDQRYNDFDERWITVGQIIASMIVVVAHLYYDDSGNETIRLISARVATASERRQYEQF